MSGAEAGVCVCVGGNVIGAVLLQLQGISQAKLPAAPGERR